MTSMVNQFTTAFILSTPYGVQSIAVGITVICILFSLLLLKELLRVHQGSRSHVWTQTLNIAIIPLLLAFTLNLAPLLLVYGLTLLARFIDWLL